jgi:hypothetical protein
MTPTELSFAGWQNRHSPSKSRPREFAAYAFLVNNLRKARGKTLGHYCYFHLRCPHATVSHHPPLHAATEPLLALNNAHATELSPQTLDRFSHLIQQSFYAAQA